MIQEFQRVSTPLGQRGKVQVTRLGLQVGRSQESQVRQLDPRTGLVQVRDELCPAGIFFQLPLEQQCHLVLDVVQPSDAFVGLLKTCDGAFQVRTAVAEDRPRVADLLGNHFQPCLHHRAAGMPHGHHVQHGQVLVLQWAALLLPLAQPDADDNQRFHAAQLHRVIENQHPVVRLRLGTRQFIQSKTQQPHPAGVGTGRLVASWQPWGYQFQQGRQASLAGTCFQQSPDEQLHHSGRILVSGQRRGEFYRWWRRWLDDLDWGLFFACSNSCRSRSTSSRRWRARTFQWSRLLVSATTLFANALPFLLAATHLAFHPSRLLSKKLRNLRSGLR